MLLMFLAGNGGDQPIPFRCNLKQQQTSRKIETLDVWPSWGKHRDKENNPQSQQVGWRFSLIALHFRTCFGISWSQTAPFIIFFHKKAQSNLTRVVVFFKIKFWPSVLNTEDSLQFEWVKSPGIKSGAAAPQLRGNMKDAGSHVWVPPRQLPRCHMPLPWGEHRETPYLKQLHFAHEGGMNFSLT